ncbi:MAG: hypothetical protein GF419_01585 [Ignavibacteriales bacterium]|nr:hypothetical protein [Ignavibacteriales bacterium]
MIARTTYPFVLAALALLFGCGAPDTVYTVGNGVNLKAYHYVYVEPAKVYDKFAADVYVEQLFSGVGMTALDGADYEALPPEEKEKAMRCRLKFITVSEQSTAMIECHDAAGARLYTGYGETDSWTDAERAHEAYYEAFEGFAYLRRAN